MIIIIIIFGMISGYILNIMSKKMGSTIFLLKGNYNILIILLSSMATILCYVKYGINIVFIKEIIFSYILILTAAFDAEFSVIPDYIVIITALLGGLFILTFSITPLNAVLGAIVGGGLLFLLALIPGAIGGGDVKFMFAVGLFLGVKKVLTALLLAFILAAAFSMFLLILKRKGRKDYIPFGPFLALGSFLSLLL